MAPAPGSRWELYSKFNTRPSFQKSEEAYNYDLEAGSHVLQFIGEHARVEASFDLELRRTVKPLESLVEQGLTLLTMALPILITGIVALLFEGSLGA